MSKKYERIVALVRDTLVEAGSKFSADKKEAYKRAISQETNKNAKWVLEKILENAEVAEKNASPLCDDTGIPHLFLEIGPRKYMSGETIEAILEGVRQGLRILPGRPMAISGDDAQRISQAGGLDPDSGAVEPSPILIRRVEEDVIRLHILMQGGGPAIRGKTYRIYHMHSVQTVVDEIVAWANEAVGLLGCSPCTLAIGIGRSQLEAAALMTQAQIEGRYDHQSDLEKAITDRVNESNIGALGMHGNVSVLGTFMRVGPQRASGVRIACLRPCCCFEPRLASVELD